MGLLIDGVWQEQEPAATRAEAAKGDGAKADAAKAAGRFSAGNVSTKIACSTGASPPPPMPCSTRKKINRPSDDASPHSRELTVKSATQTM